MEKNVPQLEKEVKPMGGGLMLLLVLAMAAGGVVALVNLMPELGVPLLVIAMLMSLGFMIIDPNNSRVLVFFGKYEGTVKENGFFWVNPFYVKKSVSLRLHNFDSNRLKVNDKNGNPIEVAAVVVWRVRNTARAVFEVEDYKGYVHLQSESALRHLASTYAYDQLDDEHERVLTLLNSSEIVNAQLQEELNERLAPAGIIVEEARLSHLAYSPEIAHAMLQRQQAAAVVAARRTIVEGAVGMVDLALHELERRRLVDWANEDRAQVVSNLLVVLCSDRSVNPVINAGSDRQPSVASAN